MTKNRLHLVLRSKVTGKIASRTDQEILAIRLEATILNAAARCHGIQSLLLPRNERERMVLQRACVRYEIAEVKNRASGERQRVSSSVETRHELIVQLAELYLKSINYSEHKISVKSFVRWLCRQLEKHESEVCKYVFALNPVLADRRSPGWWENRIANRRRSLKLVKEKNRELTPSSDLVAKVRRDTGGGSMNQNEILELKAIIGGGAGDNLSKGLLPISRSTWYRGIRAGRYPRPIRLSPRRVGWRRCDIETLLATLR